jgi:hypothetical protein
MTPATDTILELRYTSSAMLGSDFLILLVELCFQTSYGLLPPLLLCRYGTAQGLVFLLDLVSLLDEDLLCYALLLFVGTVRLTLLVSCFHEGQKLIFEGLKTLLASVNFSQDGAIFLIGFHFEGLALRLANRLLMVCQLALEGPLLPLTLLDGGLLLDHLLVRCRTRRLIGLQTLRELLLLESQSPQTIIHLL